jgi:hypothetical protein
MSCYSKLIFFCVENDVENADPQKGGAGARTRKVNS